MKVKCNKAKGCPADNCPHSTAHEEENDCKNVRRCYIRDMGGTLKYVLECKCEPVEENHV